MMADRRLRPGLEIRVDEPAGVVAALSGGADRIELCSALAAGGLTPSTPLVEFSLGLAVPAGLKVHAMVRPRAGDFDYDSTELALAVQEARSLIDVGVHGLVFGAVREGKLDVRALANWVGAIREASATVRLTLHRAIDVVEDPVGAVEVAVDLGFDDILTSGGAKSAPAGVATIARMVERSADRCRIMAGAGVSTDNAAIVLASGVHDLHASASRARPALPDAYKVLQLPAPPRRTNVSEVGALREVIENEYRRRD
jgi:copper homeostasis protein